MNKNVLLLDIDYTLFNADKYRDLTYPLLRKLLEQEDTPQYHSQVKEIERSLIKAGGYEPVTFAKTLAHVLQIPEEKKEIESLFYNKDLYNSCIYPDVFSMLNIFSQKKELTLGIISQGEDTFQRRKIEPIKQYFKESNIFIATNKMTLIEKLLRSYQQQKIYIVDDSEKFLSALQQADKGIVTILIERENRYEGRQRIDTFIPDFRVKTFHKLPLPVDRQSGS